MKTILLRPAEPKSDFDQLVSLFLLQDDEPTLLSELERDFEKQRERILHKVASDEQGNLLGFYWASLSQSKEDPVYFYLIVKPEHRGQGVACCLYEDMLRAVQQAGAKQLCTAIHATDPASLAFAGRRGFAEHWRRVAARLDLAAFDDRPYDSLIARLAGEGFQFTSMEGLGNTEEAQRKLFTLNNATSADVMGSDGEYPWASFEEFQQCVCQSSWYRPAGQIVAIDTASGTWAAMCAITRFEGRDYARTLHIGVDRAFRGRKLGQAVRVLAARYARDALQAASMFTTHLAKNAPALAIDDKLGYQRLWETALMEKSI